MGSNCYSPILRIDGYNLERNNLNEEDSITGTVLYVDQSLNYIRRRDIEAKPFPTIWLEINPNSPTAWLFFLRYNQFRAK